MENLSLTSLASILTTEDFLSGQNYSVMGFVSINSQQGFVHTHQTQLDQNLASP